MHEYTLNGKDRDGQPVVVTITITDEWLQLMANRAARNRTGVSRVGGVVAKVSAYDRHQVRLAVDRAEERKLNERIAREHAAEGDVWGERRLEADADEYERWENRR